MSQFHNAPRIHPALDILANVWNWPLRVKISLLRNLHSSDATTVSHHCDKNI